MLKLPTSPLSVSQLNRQVKQLLETQYPAIPVQGEISTLSKPASGHLYLTLKDNTAQIRCAMFKGSLARNAYRPKQGDEVLVQGRLSLYEGRGDYQLIITSMQPIGTGALQAEFFILKERLGAEGLFEQQHKKPLPTSISRVGIVTSSTGAALHDILTVLNRRFPALSVVLYPTQVQGETATSLIVDAIQIANRRNEVDVLIVGRGGGSLEDLWCFNTEAVARAIYASDLPIISAVGHEVDVSIADWVADARAATPSQAAEMVSPDQFDLMQRLDQSEQRLLLAITTRLSQQNQRLNHLSQRLRNPVELVKDWQSNLNSLTQRLFSSIRRPMNQQQDRLDHLSKRLALASPEKGISRDQQRLSLYAERLDRGGQLILESKRARFVQALSQLNLLSPLATLERGYSITRDEHGQVLMTSEKVNAGDEIETILQSGTITSVVKSTHKPR